LRIDSAPDRLTYVSEVGYGGLTDLVADMRRYHAEGNPITPDYRYHERLLASLAQVMEVEGLYDVFRSESELCLASQEIQAVSNKLQLEALRLNPRVAGYCLHALTSGDWIYGCGDTYGNGAF
jgi:hypothetical protein